jgi:hypothetical protein
MDIDKPKHCKRSKGTDRAWFRTQEEAVAFANDRVNVHYHGDIAHRCHTCGYWHLSRIDWLIPTWVKEEFNRKVESAVVN